MSTATDVFTGSGSINGQALSTGAGLTWSVTTGGLSYRAGGGVRATSAGADNKAIVAGLVGNEHPTEVDISVAADSGARNVQPRVVALWDQALGNWWEAIWNAGNITLYRVVNNSYTGASKGTVALADAAGHNFGLRITRSDTGVLTVHVTIDGVDSALSATDTSPFCVPGVWAIGTFNAVGAGVDLYISAFSATKGSVDTPTIMPASGEIVALGAVGTDPPFFSDGVSFRSSTATTTALLDGDTTTIIGSTISPGRVWVDCLTKSGVANKITVSKVRIAVRYPIGSTIPLDAYNLGNVLQDWEQGINGAKIYGANKPDLTDKVLLQTVDAIGTSYYGGAVHWTIPVNAVTGYRIIVIEGAGTIWGTTNYLSIADLEVIGTLSAGATTPYRPEAPAFSNPGGMFQTRATTFLSSGTTSGAIYYNVGANPADPTSGSTLYVPGTPIVLTGADLTTGRVKVKAICIDNGHSSLVTTTSFHDAKYRMGQDLIDDRGRTVRGDMAGSWYDDGTDMIIVGQNVDRFHSKDAANDYFNAGALCFKSDRLYPGLGNMRYQGIVTLPDNVAAHNEANLSRPRVFKVQDGSFVKYDNCADRAISSTHIKVSTAPSAAGPWTVVGNLTNSYANHDIIVFTDTKGTGRNYLIQTNLGTQTILGTSYADNRATIVQRLALNGQTINTSVGPWLLADEAINKVESATIHRRKGVYFFCDQYLNPYDASATATIPRYKSATAADFETAIASLLSDTWKTALCKSDVGRTALTDTSAWPAAYPANYSNVQIDGFQELADWTDGGGEKGFLCRGSHWHNQYIRDSRLMKWPVEFPTDTTMRVVVADAWDLPDYFSGPPRPGALTVSSITDAGATVATAAPGSGTGPYTYKLKRANDSSGVAGAYSDVTAFAAATSNIDTSAGPVTGYWYQYDIKDVAGNVVSSDAYFVKTAAPSGPVTITPSADGVLYDLVGANTAWNGSPFSLVGGSGAVLSEQTVTDVTHAQLVIIQNGDPGPYTISDGTNEFDLPAPATGFASSIFGPNVWLSTVWL